MLIKIHNLKNSYSIDFTNIFHVGAHNCEELSDYIQLGAKKIHWVEAMKNKIKDIDVPNCKNQMTLAVVSDKEGNLVNFNTTNNGQSSSILELKEHLKEHPHIKNISSEKRITTTIDSILENSILKDETIGFLNIDIQGAELLALKGAKKTLVNVNSIYIEVNEKELYSNCALLPQIDEYLSALRFKRVETEMTKHGWGDAFYIK